MFVRTDRGLQDLTNASMSFNLLPLICYSLLLFIFLLSLRSAYVIIYTYWFIPRRIKHAMRRQGVSGPNPRFLSGNLAEMAAITAETASSDEKTISHDIVGRLLPHFLIWSKQYGNRFIYWCNTEPRMCLAEAELVKEFLSAKYVHISGKSWLQRQNSKHFIGRGLLMANGGEWYNQRQIVAPAFTPDRIKRCHMSYMTECATKMLDEVERDCRQATSAVEVEIGGYITRLTADIISRTAFGSSYEKGNKIFSLLTSLQLLCAQSSQHYWFPGSRYFPSKYNREVKALNREVEKLLMEIIQTRKVGTEVGRGNGYGGDLLGMLLLEMKTTRPGFNFDLQLLMDECKTFYFAGHDTTALLTTWTIMLLASNPYWQDKARAEVLDVCKGSSPSIDDLPKLTLLHMIVNESLRLYPPAALLPRMIFENMKLGDLHIPKGLSIWIPVLAIHHDEALWGKDVHEFNPERFAGKPLGRLFMPFSAGPRHCVGQTFAMVEAKIILAMFLSRFSFTISENYRHSPTYVLTLKPKYGVPIMLRTI